MKVFDSFSSDYKGIQKVIEIGCQSIKYWHNEKIKKCFELYMQELKSFIHLPNFLTLFVKNHSYVTFLFEVASGMPDDQKTTRNWEE